MLFYQYSDLNQRTTKEPKPQASLLITILGIFSPEVPNQKLLLNTKSGQS